MTLVTLDPYIITGVPGVVLATLSYRQARLANKDRRKRDVVELSFAAHVLRDPAGRPARINITITSTGQRPVTIVNSAVNYWSGGFISVAPVGGWPRTLKEGGTVELIAEAAPGGELPALIWVADSTGAPQWRWIEDIASLSAPGPFSGITIGALMSQIVDDRRRLRGSTANDGNDF